MSEGRQFVRGMLIAFPALSAVFFVLYIGAASIGSSNLAFMTVFFWGVSMLFLMISFSGQAIGEGLARYAPLAWLIGLGTVFVTLLAGFILLAAMFGMH